MKKIVGLWVLYLGTVLCAFSQVDTSYIYNTNMPYGTLDLRLAKSPTRYYYLQEGVTFSFRESSPGVKTNTYVGMTNWNTSAYMQGNLREVNGNSNNFVMNYRLLKPNSYDPNFSPGYPIIIMFHGAGESANCWIDERCYWADNHYNPLTNRPPAPTDAHHKLLNNDRNLLHGGAEHLTAVNLAGSKLPDDPGMASRAFPGFVLFPQSLNGWGPHTTVEDAIRILRLVIKKYNIDQSRVYIHGLSNGGGAVFQALKRAPWLFAAALPMSAVNDGGIVGEGFVPEVSKIPLWIFQGGQDLNPTPYRTYRVVRNFRDVGGDVRYYLYENLGHGTWNTAYREPDFFSWMREKRKYNPHVFFGAPVICNTNHAGVHMGFSKGFYAYQWERDGVILSGETGAEIVANVPGRYRGRFSRVPNPGANDWERWSDPIVVTEMTPVSPKVDILGTAHLRGPGLPSTDENNTVGLRAAEPAELYDWYKNGSPLNFSGTDVNDTMRVATITSPSTYWNGVYTLVVKNSNCPSPPSDPVNLFFNGSSPVNISIDTKNIDFRGTAGSASIFLTWNDASSAETGYEIWRREVGAEYFEFVTKTNENAISYLDTTVHAGTEYEYKFRAVSNSGRSHYLPSDDLSVNYRFTTLGDSRYPGPPQALTVVSNTLNTITLRWKAANDESSIREYYIDYNGETVHTGSAATSYTLTGLRQNAVYAVTVKAIDYGNHVSQPSNQVMATTYLSGLMYKHSTGAFESLDDSAMIASWANPEFTGTVPNFTLEPRTQQDYFNFQFTGYLDIETQGEYYFSISSDDGSRLILDGKVVADNDGLHGNRTVNSDAVFLTAGVHAIEVQYFDDVLSHSLTVRYKGPGIGDGNTFVRIPDSALRSGTYTPPPAPAAPAGVNASASGVQRIDVQWQYNDNGGIAYEVYRSLSNNGPYEIAARVEGTSAVDSVGLTPGTLYFYRVKAVTSTGSSAFSATASAKTGGDGIAPSVPEGLAVMTEALTEVAFSWKPSTDNVGVTGYEIFSGTELIGTSTLPAFTARDMVPNVEYTFTVKAMDASGNRSAASGKLAVVTHASAKFYSLASGDLNELSTWRRNADGTGESPVNFSANGQYFTVTNRTSATIGGPWTVGGSASRVIVPTGVTLTADDEFSAPVELEGTAVLNLNNSSPPQFMKVSAQSTVNFDGCPLIPGGVYGHVILSGSVPKTFDADTITVLGDLTVNEGIALKGASHNGSYIRLAGALHLSGTRPPTAADNTVDLGFLPGDHTISTAGDVDLYRIATVENQVVNVVNPSGDPVKISMGSLKGGGLLLADGSVLDVGIHSLAFRDAAVINPGQQTGRLAMDGGDLVVATSGAQSHLYFDASHHRLDYLEIDVAASGVVSVEEPVEVAEGIKIKQGTLASSGNITLIAGEDHTGVIYEIENSGKITGDVSVQKRLEANGKVYHYLSAPVRDVSVSEWQAAFPITGNFSGASGSGAASLFYFDESKGGWVAYPGPDGSADSPIQGGIGYAALLTNETEPITLSMTGNPYQGSVEFDVSPSAGGSASDGWTFLGNPFASPIVWAEGEGWSRSGISNVIAIRKNTRSSGTVRSQVHYYDLTLGADTIPEAGGFWVKAFTMSPALSVNEKAKPDAQTDTTASPQWPHVVVSLVQGDLSDPAYIVFSDSASDGYDVKWDGRKMSNYGLFNLSTIAQDTIRLAVNHLNIATCSQTVSLDVEDVPPGSYSLSFENLESLPSIGEVLLVDNFTGKTTKMTGADYVFSVTEDTASFGQNRFAITFNQKALDMETPRIEITHACAPEPGKVTLEASQEGVVYYVVNEKGDVISEETTGNGETVEIALQPEKLSEGSNKIRVSAGFPGCNRRFFEEEFNIDLVPELQVTAEGNISICQNEDVTLTASGTPTDGFYHWYDSNGELIEGQSSDTLLVQDVLNEEVYYVASALAGGCESKKAEIHIYPDTLNTPVIEMVNDTLFTQVVAASYQWTRNEMDIEDATLPYFIPTINGRYTIVASNTGCVKQSEIFIFSDGITGIEDANNPEFVLQVYPIPTGGEAVNVTLRSPRTDPVLIEIIDMLGRIHYSQSLEARTLFQGVEIRPFAPLYDGIYILQATQGNIEVRKKIIVKD